MAFAPIDAAQFQELWESSVDEAYAAPFLQYGADACFEVWGQEFAQFVRVSEAIDVSTQSMFILPWSGQSNPSAQGSQSATVTLTFTRTSKVNLPLVIDTDVPIDEVTNDYGPTGPVPITTGRRYFLNAPVVFNPGEVGPIMAVATAERPGYGYNNPLPGSLNTLDQPGSNLANQDAAYVYAPGAEVLTAPNVPDMPIPQHVGQYMAFTKGANAGAIKRVVGYGPPNVTADVGGQFFLESMAVVQGTTADTFTPGEKVTLAGTTTATGVMVKQTTIPGGTEQVLSFTLNNGVLPSNPVGGGVTLTGASSGAVATVDAVLLDPTLTNTPFDPTFLQYGSGWAMVSWSDPSLGWGVTVTNLQQPAGGLSPMLDELGDERNIARAPGESDESYAERVHQLADTVSPNAVLRAANRIMAPYGLSACLREVGQELFAGFFLDWDAFDYDFTIRPSLGRHVLLDYEQFRAYFFIGVPQLPWGEFGFAYDTGAWNAYDTTGPEYLAFYDGYPWQAAKFYLSIYNAIAGVIAGGVGFTLYYETAGCQP